MIAILGTGPAGLMAAHACAILGQPFALFSLPDKHGHVSRSRIGGAQFLHCEIPSLTAEEPDFVLTYRTNGTPEGYHQKVYGGDPKVPFVSMSNVTDGERVPAWNLRTLYNLMWDGICGEDGHSVNAQKVDAATLKQWLEDDEWPLIISTVPRSSLCLTHAGLVDRMPHSFMSQTIHIVMDEDMGIPYNTIEYDGSNERSWYRSSNINGIRSTEWGENALPRYHQSKAVTVRKPISHTCDCWKDDDRVVFAGRYGRWQKGILVQDGFITAFKAIEERS